MFKRSQIILLAILLAVCLGALLSLMLTDHTTAREIPAVVSRVDLDEVSPPYVEPSVRRMLHDNTDEIPVIVVLHSTMSPGMHSDGSMHFEPSQDQQSFVNDLRQSYQNSRDPIEPLLSIASQKGDLLSRKDLWIVNGMALTVRPDFLRQLLTSSSVKSMYLDRFQSYLGPVDAFDTPITMTMGSVVENSWGIDRIRIAQVWQTFGISGTDAVVAIMDTGVDFLHPVLSGNYRGHLGKGLYNHNSAWFDAVNGGLYPYDDQGHGSHVAGTAVGTSNIGVAPGAKWIGVKVLDTDGFGYDSWILNGFQWMLSPGGDASLAPDVVNASWSKLNASDTVFELAINTLSEAGIFFVAANGNEGPAMGSVGSPASIKGVFAVGASGYEDVVVDFSSRGPSPWREIKPYVVAPGVNIVSSIPGGVYAENSGTSMATPHVAGLAAILRGFSQTLPVATLANIITETAVPVSVTIPNNVSGWGRIDAYEAVIRLVNPAIITGNIKTSTGQNIDGASVVARSHFDPGLEAQTITDNQGRYTLAINPGLYDLEITAFGYYSQFRWGVEVTAGMPVNMDFFLLPQPTGIINGLVYISGTNQLVTETVDILLAGTPLTTASSSVGAYQMVAPIGTYSLTIKSLGYRVSEIGVRVQAGETTTQDIYVISAPTLLLVDEGAWYYDSQLVYWSASLDSLGYVYDVRTIKYPHLDTPSEGELLTYDVVLWSSPGGAPGLVGGAEPLQRYLEAGGRLFISGQDIAYFDAGGLQGTSPKTYLRQMMGVLFTGECDDAGGIHGQGPFADMQLLIHGEDGADNQIKPDIVQISDTDFGILPWVYDHGAGAGSAVYICTPYRAMFLGFGFEAIAGVSNRHEVMRRSLEWLTSEPLTTGLSIRNISNPVQIGRAGTRITHTLAVRHIGMSGSPEMVTINVHGASWPFAIVQDSFELAPCTSFTVNVAVTIPQESAINMTDGLTLTVESAQSHTSATTHLTTKTPAAVLLVDDDRFYPVEHKYIDALDKAGLFYDVWDTQDDLGALPGNSLPQTDTLNLYPILLWFTGYDWFEPVSDLESARLIEYLDTGGRLILSSQDFLYYHEADDLAYRLGIQAVSDGQEIMKVRGTAHPASGQWDGIELEYPFPLHTDIVEPMPTASIVLRGRAGQPLGVAKEMPLSGNPATIFYGVSLEALPFSIRAEVLSTSIGWLSPLGRSLWQVSPSRITVGDTLTYTLVLRNNDLTANMVSAAHYLPLGQVLNVPSLPSDFTYDASHRLIFWGGELLSGQVVTYVWQTHVLVVPTSSTYPTVTLSLVDWGLEYERFAPFHGPGPELAQSTWISPANSDIQALSAVTLSFLMLNSSDATADIQASVWIMEGLSPLTETTPMTDNEHGWSISWWTGSVEPYSTQLMTLPLKAWVWDGPVRVDGLLTSEQGYRWEFPIWLNVTSWKFYLPWVIRKG